MTPEEIAEEVCLVTVTDPEASTCLASDATELTSWIRVELNPNVEYTIDGVVVTEEFTSVTPGIHEVVATALNGYTLEGAQPEPDNWTDTTHSWVFTAIDSAACEPPTLATVLPSFSWEPMGCTTRGSYTIGAEFGDVIWTVNGVPTGAGTYYVDEPSTLTLAVSPADGSHGFDEAWTQGSDEFELEFARPAENCEPPTLADVLPSYSSTPMTCTAAGTYTIGAEYGAVTWTVNGVETPAGTYTVKEPGEIVIEAVPTNDADTLAAEWADEPITLSFALPTEECEKTALALAFTGAVVAAAPLWAAAAALIAGLALLLLRRKNTAQ